MDRYDEYTRKFMEDVAAGKPVISRDQKAGVGALGSFLPQKARPAVRAATRFLPSEEEGQEKEAAAPSSVVHLYRVLNEKFDKEWMDWEPETVWKEASEIGINVNEEIRNVIGALQTVVNTNFPFEAWHIFENVAHAFAGNDVNFSVVQPLDLTDAAGAIKVLTEIRPQVEFEPEILAYIAAVAKSSGVVYLPPEYFLNSQEYLDQLNNDMPLKKEVEALWPKVKQGEDDLAIQTQKLYEIREYVNG